MSGFDRTSWKNYLQGIVPSFNFYYQDESSPSINMETEVLPIAIPTKSPKHNKTNRVNIMIPSIIRGGRSRTRKQTQTEKRKQKRRTQNRVHQ
jgi:hypothetical protein